MSICVSGPSLRTSVWYRSSPKLRPWPTTSPGTPRSTNNTSLKTPSTATITTPRAPTRPSPRWRRTARRSDRHPVTARAPIRSRATRGWTPRRPLRFWTHRRGLGLWGPAAAGVRVTRTPQPRVTTVIQTLWRIFRLHQESLDDFMCLYPPVSGYYGHGGYLDSQRMTSLVDQHVSVISTVSSLRPFPDVYPDVHDPLNILDEPGRKTTGAYFAESEPGPGWEGGSPGFTVHRRTGIITALTCLLNSLQAQPPACLAFPRHSPRRTRSSPSECPRPPRSRTWSPRCRPSTRCSWELEGSSEKTVPEFHTKFDPSEAKI